MYYKEIQPCWFCYIMVFVFLMLHTFTLQTIFDLFWATLWSIEVFNKINQIDIADSLYVYLCVCLVGGEGERIKMWRGVYN